MRKELIEFREAMLKGGVPFDGVPIADGEIHRFYVEGHKKGSANGWYVLYSDKFHAGTFGNWKEGVSINWCSKRIADMDQNEQKKHRYRMKKAKKERQIKKQIEHEAAAKKAAFIWQSSRVVKSHPYLIKKGISAHGVRQHKESLVVPVRNKQGELRSLQFITAEGSKYFLSGGEIMGNYSVLYTHQGLKKKLAIICEGYATGATLHDATGSIIVVAFNSGNLSPVALNVWAKHMDWQFIIAADNDHKAESQGKRNVGIEEGSKTAIKIGASLVYPSFPLNTDGSDFNDLAGIEPLTGLLTLVNSIEQEAVACQ